MCIVAQLILYQSHTIGVHDAHVGAIHERRLHIQDDCKEFFSKV